MNGAVELIEPEKIAMPEIADTGESCIEEVHRLRIVDQPSLEAAALALNRLSELKKQITHDFAESVTAANAAHKALTRQRKGHLEPLDAAIKWVRSRMADYKLKKDEEARADRARIEVEQRKAAEQRQAVVLEEADALEEAGRGIEADQVVDEGIATERVAQKNDERKLRTSVPATKGVTFAKVWKARVRNTAAFFDHVARDPELRALNIVMIDMGALNRYATKNHADKPIDGIEFYQDEQPRAMGMGR